MASTLPEPSATVRAPPAPSRPWHTMAASVVYHLCFDLLVLYVTIESTSSAPHRRAIGDPGIATSHVERSAGLHAPAHALTRGASPLMRGAPDPLERTTFAHRLTGGYKCQCTSSMTHTYTTALSSLIHPMACMLPLMYTQPEVAFVFPLFAPPAGPFIFERHQQRG